MAIGPDRFIEDEQDLRCLKCGSGWMARSRRRWWERLFRSLSYWRPYRCHGCGVRSWYRIGKPDDEPQTGGIASFLIR